MNKNTNRNKILSTFLLNNDNNKYNDIDLFTSDDSYGLLDLGKPIESSSSSSVQNEYSIDNQISNLDTAEQKMDITKIKFEDKLDPENKVDLNGEQSWLVVVRDSIEQRLGRPIWTSKSPQQLQLEYRRSQALRAMALPDYVKHLILSVYIERTISMRQYNKDFKYEVKEFRKWLSEQKQRMGKSKTKKSPFMMAKLDISKVC